jgi:hypothetical protein
MNYGTEFNFVLVFGERNISGRSTLPDVYKFGELNKCGTTEIEKTVRN